MANRVIIATDTIIGPVNRSVFLGTSGGRFHAGTRLERGAVVAEGEPTCTAIHEIESPQVLVSREWAESSEAGRWPKLVRPYTKNHRHMLRQGMEPGAATATGF